jgi:hypothetical protein
MSVKTDIDGLTAAIEKEVKMYTEAVQKAIGSEAKNVAQKTLERVKGKAPVKTGKYKKGFKVKDESTLFSALFIIHNATHPWLVHLLENGHSLRSGGRTRSFSHVKQAEKTGVEELEAAIIKIVERGG